MGNKYLYNSRIINTYIKLIKKKYNFVNINELLSYAKMEPYQIEDQGHWFTQEQINLFHEKMTELTGNKDIAREAGRYAISPDSIGAMRQYFLSLVNPAKVYEKVGKAASYLTRSTIYESKKIGENKIEIIVRPREGVKEEQFQCENRMGYMEALTMIFNYKLPSIEHTECFFKGGDKCRYVVSWQKTPSDLWKKIRNYVILTFTLICIVSYFMHTFNIFSNVFVFSLILILIFVIIAGIVEKRELNKTINNIRLSTDQLLEQINLNYNQALMINEIGLALSKQMDIDIILEKVIQILAKRLDYDRGMIFLANKDRTMLIFRAGYGYTEEQLEILKNSYFHLNNPDSKGTLIVSFREQKPLLINDINEIENNLSLHSLEFAKKMKAISFICCPIIYEKESIGILTVDNVKTKKPLVQRDVNLLMGIAPEIGISIHNALLIENKEQQFKSMLQVLAASIDARDPLTAGHSEKVTEYALGICNELGLDKNYCEMIRATSLLHDYGKLGIKDSILKKEGKLNIDEYEEIKTHVIKTKKILEQINFEGIYKEVPGIAACHHEKIDGTGYPNGLKGEEIPLGARIIAVADVFEAITSKRPYREAMSIDLALELIKFNVGKHFDKEVVDAFISYINKKNKQNI